ncbi:MAG: rhodanese-like domain-containing protein [Sandaracinaceae bacterium]|nr:rhodanese-like domain-containing protein [Sandaracinaceae bacterium]
MNKNRSRGKEVFDVLLLCLAGIGLNAALREVPKLAPSEAARCAHVDAPPSMPQWIEPEEAMRLLERGDVLFVDARSEALYERGHVPGALPACPEDEALSEEVLNQARAASAVITYCDAERECEASRHLAERLVKEGVRNVRVLRGGMPAWLERELPAESGPPPKLAHWGTATSSNKEGHP